MSNRAWMPLNIDDYLADTGHLTAVEHGAYMLLIMHYWKHGALPADERLIARIARISPDQWAESRDILAAFFGDGWSHKRIDTELAKADEIIEKRREAANRRHQSSKSNADASAGAVQVQSKSSDTGALPSTIEPSSSLRSDDPPVAPQGGGAGDLFDEIVSIFPRSPHSNEARAEKAFRRLNAKDQVSCLDAAKRYATWFPEEQARRKRSITEALTYAPPLDKWISEGAWRNAGDLPLNGETPTGQDIAVVAADDPIVAKLEQIRGKPFVVGTSGKITVLRSELEKARNAA